MSDKIKISVTKIRPYKVTNISYIKEKINLFYLLIKTIREKKSNINYTSFIKSFLKMII